MIHADLIILALALQAQPYTLKSAKGEPIEVLRIWRLENDAGWLALQAGNLAKAEVRFRAAIEAVRPYHKADPRLMARSYCDLAQVLFQQARFDQAEPLAKWSLGVREKIPGIPSILIYQNLYILAQIHCAQHRFDDAEPLLRRALAIQKKTLDTPPVGLATTLDDLAWVISQTKTGSPKEAESLYKRALDLFTKSLPQDDLRIAATSDRYAKLLRRLDRLTEAEWLEARARTIRAEAAIETSGTEQPDAEAHTRSPQRPGPPPFQRPPIEAHPRPVPTT